MSILFKDGNPIRFRFFFVLLVFLLLSGCNSGGGGSSDDDQKTVPPIGDMSGEWDISENASSNDPECSGYSSYVLDVTQTGNSLSVTDEYGNAFHGAINGNSFTWKGSYPEEGGTTTIHSLEGVVLSGCQEVNGNSQWSWSNGNASCSGTTSFVGYRRTGNGCDEPGDQRGYVRFYNNLQCDNENVTLTFHLCDQELSAYSGNWSDCMAFDAPKNYSFYITHNASCGPIDINSDIDIYAGQVAFVQFGYNPDSQSLELIANYETGNCNTNPTFMHRDANEIDENTEILFESYPSDGWGDDIENWK